MTTDARIASPGDSDLDCHLTGLTLTSVVRIGTSVLIELDLTGASGWFGGQRHDVRELRPLRLAWERGDADPALLDEWHDRRCALELASAPGRQSTLRCDHAFCAIPRTEVTA